MPLPEYRGGHHQHDQEAEEYTTKPACGSMCPSTMNAGDTYPETTNDENKYQRDVRREGDATCQCRNREYHLQTKVIGLVRLTRLPFRANHNLNLGSIVEVRRISWYDDSVANHSGFSAVHELTPFRGSKLANERHSELVIPA